MGADVTVLDRSLPRLRYLDDVFGRQFKNGYSSAAEDAEACCRGRHGDRRGADPRRGGAEAGDAGRS
jgi:hypothetical protein